MPFNSVIKKLKTGFFRSHYLVMKININTLPLIYPEKKICLFLNEKAGCTFATNWFFFQQNLLADALDYHFWIHNYRYDVYYKQKKYKANLTSILSDEYTRIKLVRSPYQRVVSSYIHAVKTTYAIDELSNFLGREINNDNKFTFEEFIGFLEATGVEDCNPHHRTQVEKLEKSGILTIDRVIKLEDASTGFKQLEKDLDLKESDQNSILASISELSHHRQRVSGDEYCGNRMYNQFDTTFGEYTAFYNETLKNKVAGLYEQDFNQYNYSIDEL